jgi:hypothetical protein
MTIVIGFVSAVALYSQNVAIDSTRFPIGSNRSLTLEFALTPGTTVTWPTFNDTISKSVEILSKSTIDTTIADGGRKVLRQVLQITSFDTGFIVIPPIVFLTKDVSGNNSSLSSQPLLLEVYKLKVDVKADIRDIKPNYKAPVTFREVVPWILGVLFIGLSAWLLYRYFKTRPAKKIEKPTIQMKIPAWEVAFKKLDILKAEQLWQRGEIKEYYTKLTDILREYFELKFNVNAGEMTSADIMIAMDEHIQDANAINSLQSLLFLADMAKFAKAKPGISDNEQSIKFAYNIIELTKDPQTQPKIREDI